MERYIITNYISPISCLIKAKNCPGRTLSCSQEKLFWGRSLLLTLHFKWMVWFGMVTLAARALFIFACPFGSFLLAVSWSPSFLLGLLVGLAYGLPLGEIPCWSPVYWALICLCNYPCELLHQSYLHAHTWHSPLQIYYIFIRLLILNIHMRIHYIYSEILPLLCAENQRCCSHKNFIKID